MKRLSNVNHVPTIRNVAANAGVSVATASYALNGMGRVSEETRAKVKKVAEDLGYRPSLAAKVLKGGQGNLVAILTDGLAGPWYGELFAGLQTWLKKEGLAVMALTLHKDSVDLCHNLVFSGMLRGLIVLNPAKVLTSEWITEVSERIPTVILDPALVSPLAANFVIDNRGGVTVMMTHLWNRGYRNFLWLDGDPEAPDGKERWETFDQFLADKAAEEFRVIRTSGGFQSEVAARSVGQILAQGIVPRVIVAANDESAIGALQTVRKLGFRVPEQIAVAGFDGLGISAWTSPPLTTVAYDRQVLGNQMAEWIVNALDNGAARPGRVLVPVELVIRSST